MSKIRIALVSALSIVSLIAGGTVAHAHASHAVHHLAGPPLCCVDSNVMHG